MNTALQTYSFGEQNVRVVMLGEDPWFSGVDACDCLELTSRGGGHYNVLADDEKFVLNRRDPIAPNGLFSGRGQPRIMLISESGLYKLIMRSDKPAARKFQDWVTREVLPSIRKTGRYEAPQSTLAVEERVLFSHPRCASGARTICGEGEAIAYRLHNFLTVVRADPPPFEPGGDESVSVLFCVWFANANEDFFVEPAVLDGPCLD